MISENKYYKIIGGPLRALPVMTGKTYGRLICTRLSIFMHLYMYQMYIINTQICRMSYVNFVERTRRYTMANDNLSGY